MSRLLLNYGFQNDNAANPDGELEAQFMNGSFLPIDAHLKGWPPITKVALFERNTLMLAPTPVELPDAESFTIELALQHPEPLAESEMLLSAALPPISLILEPAGPGNALVAQVLSSAGWISCRAEIHISDWVSISFVFKSDEIVIICNGNVAARKSLSGAYLVGGECRGPLFIGTSVDGQHAGLNGMVGGIRVFSGIPETLRTLIAEIRAA